MIQVVVDSWTCQHEIQSTSTKCLTPINSSVEVETFYQEVQYFSLSSALLRDFTAYRNEELVSVGSPSK